MTQKHSALIALLALATIAPAAAQVSYTDVNAVYTQNFDNPSGWAGTTALPWSNGVTFANWYALSYAGPAAGTYTTPATIKPSTFAFTSGLPIYIFRKSDALTNGAFGSYSQAAPTGSGVYYGVYIQNNTGAAITSFSFGYTGAQWYSYLAAAVQTLTVSYSTDATALSDGTWTGLSDMTFSTPRVPASTGNTNTDGTLPENQMVLSTTVSDVSIAPGGSVWIRWFDVSDPGNDNALSIDNFYFTVAGTPSAVPEPSTWAAIFGASALAVAVTRRVRCTRA